MSTPIHCPQLLFHDVEDSLGEDCGTAYGLKVVISRKIQGVLYLEEFSVPKASTPDVE